MDLCTLVLPVLLLTLVVGTAANVVCYSCDPCPVPFNATSDQVSTCSSGNWCNVTISEDKTTRTCDVTSAPNVGWTSSCSSTSGLFEKKVTRCHCNYDRCNKDCTCGDAAHLRPARYVTIATAIWLACRFTVA